MNAGTGLRQLGIEHVKPLITRGVLVDLPAYKNVQRLEGGYEVTLADVRGALQRQGIAESSIMPGDAVLFRYGWAQLWSTPAEYNAAPVARHRRRGGALARRAQGDRHGRRHVDERGLAEPDAGS